MPGADRRIHAPAGTGRIGSAARCSAAAARAGVVSSGAAAGIRSFDTVEELRRALLEFCDTYNATWLIERHGFRPPSAVRREQLSPEAPAA